MIDSQPHITIPVQQKLTKSSAAKTYKIKKNTNNEKKSEGQSLYPWHYSSVRILVGFSLLTTIISCFLTSFLYQFYFKLDVAVNAVLKCTQLHSTSNLGTWCCNALFFFIERVGSALINANIMACSNCLRKHVL